MELLIIATLLIIAAQTTYLTLQTVQKGRRTAQAPVFVDTSVLIDGRITAIAESGFITRPLYIPRSVVGELQFLADNGDSDKRARARHGLDIINHLQSISGVNVIIFPDGVKADEGVDNRLLALAKKHSGALCTIDYNLNKVAVVEGLDVLNVNELAKSLRMAYLPGEKIRIELTQKGNDQHQAIGHLEDGTMVVVEHASKYLGNVVEVEFIRSLQTAAGKMMFAKLVTAQRHVKKQQSSSPAAEVVKKVQQVKAPKIPKVPAEVTGEAPVRSKASSKGRAPQQRQVRQQRSQVEPPQQSRPQVAKQPAEPVVRRPVQRNNRRRSPEDSMVELANKL